MRKKKYKVISLDMFQTLVDVSTRKEIVFQRILLDNYIGKDTDMYWREVNHILSGFLYEKIEKGSSYVSLRNIFEMSYEELFKRNQIKFDPKEGASILIEEHTKSSFFYDTLKFLGSINETYEVCIVSDTDVDMIKPILVNLEYNEAFLSEEKECYKNSEYDCLFNYVLEYYDVEPCEILHIGDSKADVIGANKCGIYSCWLNRDNRKWKYDIKPDYEVNSLQELLEIL